MVNWHTYKQEIIKNTVNAIYGELEFIIDAKHPTTANYWIDNRHNVFAELCNDNNGNSWISIYYELYDVNEDMIGDIDVMDTEDISPESLKECIIAIVNEYYGE